MALDHTCAANFPSKRIRVKRMPHEEAEDCLLDASQGNHTGYYEAIDTMCSELMAHAAWLKEMNEVSGFLTPKQLKNLRGIGAMCQFYNEKVSEFFLN